jgi:hypothetical protein
MIIFVAILIGAFLGAHPILTIPVLIFAGRKLHQSESLLACCLEYPIRKLVAYCRVIG